MFEVCVIYLLERMLRWAPPEDGRRVLRHNAPIATFSKKRFG
jgi:hypothetical protein